MEASTATGRHSTHPVSYYWEMVKDMDDSQKLELVSIIIDSVKPAVAKSGEAVHLRPYTMAEIDAMLDDMSRKIGPVDEATWHELERRRNIQ
jgi:hypothetical protein